MFSRIRNRIDRITSPHVTVGSFERSVDVGRPKSEARKMVEDLEWAMNVDNLLRKSGVCLNEEGLTRIANNTLGSTALTDFIVDADSLEE